MEDPQDNPPSNVDEKPTIQFRTQDIGIAKVNQTDFFRKHRREYAAQQERMRKIRHIAIISLSAVLLVTVAVTTLLIAFFQKPIKTAIENQIPSEMQIWNGEAQKIQNAAQEVYDADQNVSEYFEQQVSEAPADTERTNLVLVEMQFYANNFQPEAVIAASSKLNVNLLTTSQVGIYGGLLMNAYINIGDDAMAGYYLNLMEEKDAIGGGEG